METEMVDKGKCCTPRVLCPVLGSTVQERQRTTRKSPAEGYKDDKGTGASLW